MALAVPIENLGLQWLCITLLYVGAIQIVAGFLWLGKFVRLIPYPVMMGFVNGLAIVIFLSQLELFKETVNGQMQWLPDGDMALMLGLVALTIGYYVCVAHGDRKNSGRADAIIIAACITIFGGMEVNMVGSFIRDGGGGG